MRFLNFIFGTAVFFYIITNGVNGQIYWTDPSFEKDSIGTITTSNFWSNCNDLYCCPTILDSEFIFNNYGILWSASDGKKFAAIGGLPSGYLGITTNKISCPLHKNSFLSFSLDVMTTNFNGWSPPGQLKIYFGKDSCGKSELAYISNPIYDTTWLKLIIITHSDDDYNYISLLGKPKQPEGCEINIDNLSPIFIWDTTTVSGNFKNVIITKGDSIILNATSTVAYNKGWWQQVPGGDTIADSLTNIIIKPNQTTQYVACIKVCDTCCWYSYDTVTVTVINPPLPQLIVPTFITSPNTFWMIHDLPIHTTVNIYDELGRKIFSTNNYQNDFDFNAYPNATYFYEAVLGGQGVKGKIVLLKNE